MTLKDLEKLVEDNLVVRVYCGEVFMQQIMKEYLDSDKRFIFEYSYNGSPTKYLYKYEFASKNTVFKLKGVDNSYLEIIYDYFMDNISLHRVIDTKTNKTKRSSVPVIVLPFKKEIIDNYEQ